ncbi:MAG: UvrD-helicase domain-containing protein [Bacteroidia bacterium]
MSLRVIIASAGSGKTQRLAELAIMTLLERENGRRKGVLAITFTRNAAAELRNRILDRLTSHPSNPTWSELARDIILGQAPLYTQTIDSLIRELYQRVAPLLGIAVYDDLLVEEEDQIEVAHALSRYLLSRTSLTILGRALRGYLEEEVKKNARRVVPEAFLRRELLHLMKEEPIRILIRKALYEALRKNGLSSIPEGWRKSLAINKAQALLVPYLVEALEEYRQKNGRLFLADISALVQLTAHHLAELITEHTAFYHHLLVDEAQDTSPLQWEVIDPIIGELRARADSEVTLIGDPKQSIYAWRGADFRQIMQFYQQADQPEVLKRNFRSAPCIVEWNNRLYTELPHILSAYVAQKKSARSKEASTLTKHYSIQSLRELYASDTVCQVPTQSTSGEVRVYQIPHHSDEVVMKERRREILVTILEKLKRQGVPPSETVFLVRWNEQIRELLTLLFDYPLQVQQAALSSCPSVWVTFRYLLEEQGAVEITYAEAYQMQGELGSLKERLDSQISPAYRWQLLYEIYQKWMRCGVERHAPFWKLLLSHLHGFLYEHPFYGSAEIGRWWEEKAQYYSLELPPIEGVYPIFTIHRAKGLAWRAVIVPFAEWELLSVRWNRTEWRPVQPHDLPPEIAQRLSFMSSILASARPIPLPLKVSSENTDLAAVYADFVRERIVENVNLHYVATTRAREYLYLVAAEPSKNSHMQTGANSWRGFWTTAELSKGLWNPNTEAGSVYSLP